jgi:hypothetical protein
MSTNHDMGAASPKAWWQSVADSLRGRRLAMAGTLPEGLATALAVELAAPAGEDALLVCGGDLPLEGAEAAFSGLGRRCLVLVCTPEDQRDEAAVAPRLDEWVAWFARRGFFRDFRRDAIATDGCVSLRADTSVDAVLGAYQRQLEQRERAVKVIRAVAEGYRAELRLRELEIDFLHDHLAVYIQKSKGDELSAELLTAIRHLATIRRRMAPATSLRTRTFDWSLARIVELQEQLVRSFDARDAVLATLRSWTARVRPNGAGRP